MTKPGDVLRREFVSLVTRADVAALLEVSVTDLHYWFYRRGSRYRRFDIPKKSGGTRTIDAPERGTKLVQFRLAQVLTSVYEPRRNVHGFVPGRSIRTNAMPHERARWILNIDLNDFFHTIHIGRVRGLFRSYGVGEDAADLVARICSHESRLPQGAPTSPVVSNLVCRPFDRALQALSRRHRCTVTRYADDITFSTNHHAFDPAIAEISYSEGNRLVELGRGLRFAIESNGFTVNESKVRLRSGRERQEVTGLVVNRRVNVPRTYVRSVRGMIHAAERFGLDLAEQTFQAKYARSCHPSRPPISFLMSLRGRLAFVGMVKGRNDPVFVGLWNRAAGIDDRLQPRVGTADDLEKALWVIESQQSIGDRTERSHATGFALAGLGIVTAYHALGDQVRIWRPATPEKMYQATVIKLCTERDLAVLTLPGGTASAELVLSQDAPPSIGLEILTAGFPDHFPAHTQQEGRITSVRGKFGFGHIFPSFPTRRGASGSPILNAKLEVIGIVLFGPGIRPDAEDFDHRPSAIYASELVNVPAINERRLPLME